jgi:O-antigen/teichoic acid export membrane protein
LFAFVFGEEWRIAGVYAQIVVPLFFIRFIVATVSPIDTIMEKQSIYLLANIIMLFLSLLIIYFLRDATFIYFLNIFTIVTGILYLVYGFILYKFSKGL